MSAPSTNTDQTSASSDDVQRERPRRFAQFGLRPLLVFVTLSACLFGLWASWVRPYRVQQWAVDELDSSRRSDIRLAEGPAQQRWLVGARHFIEYQSFEINPDSPASKLDALGGLVFLRELTLDGTAVSERQLMAVRHMPLLETLSVDYTTIGDNGLVACNGLPKLTSLSVRYTRVTDAGLARLEPSPSLERIFLTGTDVTDGGILDLARHRQLREVYVRYTDVTEAGTRALQEALPECAVYHQTRVGHDDTVDR